ncbi:MAG: hypothetical protein JOZ62_08480 [Acidobacteriaceae bacterium]|nr:hypothetical protein [Acidobacteriaceae bacterium]
MRSDSSKQHSATRGDVFVGGKMNGNSNNRGLREARTTLRLTATELMELESRAEAFGLTLSEYIRRELMRPKELITYTRLLAEVHRLRVLTTRIWEAAAEADLTPGAVRKIESQVEAIEDRVLLGRTMKGK